MVEKVDGITHLSFFLVTPQTHISFYKYSPSAFEKLSKLGYSSDKCNVSQVSLAILALTGRVHP